MSSICANDSAHHRYTLSVDGEIRATLSYAIQPPRVLFTYAFTAPEHRGQGYAAELVEWATAEVAQDPAARIVPACGYVRGWFMDHPEHTHLLA